MHLRHLPLPLPLLLLPLTTATPCEEDLTILSSFDLSPPDASILSFCTSSLNPTTNAPSYLCDYFGSSDDDGSYQSNCTAYTGTVIPIQTELRCESGLESRIMVPWCLPQNCLEEGVDVSIGRKDAEAKEGDGAGCVSTVTRYDLCEGERGKLEGMGLGYGFPDPYDESFTLKPYCASEADYYSQPILSVTECDLNNSTEIASLLSNCTDSGGTVYNVTKTTECNTNGFIIDKVILTTPWCIPSACNVYDIYDEQYTAEKNTATCPMQITSPGLTMAPTSTPSSLPTPTPSETPSTSHPTHTPSSTPSRTPSESPTASPSDSPSTSHPTHSPSFLPSHSPTITASGFPSGGPSGSPTFQPSVTASGGPTGRPTTGEPTVTPFLCRDRAFRDEVQCQAMTAHYTQDVGLGFAAVGLVDEVCSYSTSTNETTGVETISSVCDIYQHQATSSSSIFIGDETGGIESLLTECDEAGGDAIPVTVTESCEIRPGYITNSTTIGPLCVPKSCNGTDFLEDFFTEQEEGKGIGCNKTISVDANAVHVLDVCEDECVDRSTITSLTVCERTAWDMDLREEFYETEQVYISDANFEQACDTIITNEGRNVTVDCIMYRFPDVYNRIETCTRNDGDSVRVRLVQTCFVEDFNQTTVLITDAPMCIPKNCDAEDYIPGYADDLSYKAEPGCSFVAEYDLADVGYCEDGVGDVPEPLGEQCLSDIALLERSTGKQIALEDGVEKVCTTLYINGIKNVNCGYWTGFDYSPDIACLSPTTNPDATLLVDTVPYNTTTTTECLRYGVRSVRTEPNLMCLPASCVLEDVTDVLVYERNGESLGCEVLGSEEVVEVVVTEAPVEVAEDGGGGGGKGGEEDDSEDGDDSEDKDRGSTSEGVVLGRGLGLVVLGVWSFLLVVW